MLECFHRVLYYCEPVLSIFSVPTLAKSLRCRTLLLVEWFSLSLRETKGSRYRRLSMTARRGGEKGDG